MQISITHVCNAHVRKNDTFFTKKFSPIPLGIFTRMVWNKPCLVLKFPVVRDCVETAIFDGLQTRFFPQLVYFFPQFCACHNATQSEGKQKPVSCNCKNQKEQKGNQKLNFIAKGNKCVYENYQPIPCQPTEQQFSRQMRKKPFVKPALCIQKKRNCKLHSMNKK